MKAPNAVIVSGTLDFEAALKSPLPPLFPRVFGIPVLTDPHLPTGVLAVAVTWPSGEAMSSENAKLTIIHDATWPPARRAAGG